MTGKAKLPRDIVRSDGRRWTASVGTNGWVVWTEVDPA